MHGRTLHLHSMLVHSVLAFVPLAALAFVLAENNVQLGSFGTALWRFLAWISLIVVLAVGVLATVSGILERRHLYVTWHRTHTWKLWLGLALVGLAAFAAAMLAGALPLPPAAGWVALGSLVLVAGALTALGLKMSLGRQSLGRTSYRPDVMQTPPIDILAATAARLAEPPDVIDVTGEAWQP